MIAMEKRKASFQGRPRQRPFFPSRNFLLARRGKGVLNDCLVFGGMPGLIGKKDEKSRRFYLKNRFTKTYIRDVAERKKTVSEDVFMNLLSYLASEARSLTNVSIVMRDLSSKLSRRLRKKLNMQSNNYAKSVRGEFGRHVKLVGAI